MRVCPKCGHYDPWYWRGSGVAVGLEFARLSDFEQDYPELAKALVEARNLYNTKNFVFDKDYCYHLTKGLRVERQSIIENPMPKGAWHIPREASPNKNRISFGVNPHSHGKRIGIHTYRKDHSQTKLLEEKPKGKISFFEEWDKAIKEMRFRKTEFPEVGG